MISYWYCSTISYAEQHTSARFCSGFSGCKAKQPARTKIVRQAAGSFFFGFLFCFGSALITHAKHGQAVIFRHNTGAGIDQGLELCIRDMDTFYLLAAAAVQLLMIFLRAFKTVLLSGEGNEPNLAKTTQCIGVAGKRSRARSRTHGPQRCTDLLCGGIIAARKYLPQNQFTLMRIAHIKNLLLKYNAGKNSKHFPLYIVYMIPVSYHNK